MQRDRGREEWEMGDTRTDRQADSECRIGGAVRLRGGGIFDGAAALLQIVAV